MNKISNRAIAEIIGLIGIIASLLFVGVEIQQTSTVARLEAYQRFTESMAEVTNDMAQNQELAAIVLQSGSTEGIQELTPAQTAQIFALYMSVLWLWSGMYQSVEEGVLPERYLDSIARGQLFNSPFLKIIWPQLRDLYSDDFASFIETLPWNSE